MTEDLKEELERTREELARCKLKLRLLRDILMDMTMVLVAHAMKRTTNEEDN